LKRHNFFSEYDADHLKCHGLQAIDTAKVYALGAKNVGSVAYDIHMIMADFTPGNVKASYHSIEELKSNNMNRVLNGRFYGSQLYVMGGLRSLTPLSPLPTFYDSTTSSTGFLLKLSTTAGD
jgi:hypothetical protein